MKKQSNQGLRALSYGFALLAVGLSFVACSSDDAHSGGQGGASNGGSAGSAAGGASNGGSAGSASCAISECFRATTCVASCGGKVVSSGCCPCVAPAIDELTCAGSGGGA